MKKILFLVVMFACMFFIGCCGGGQRQQLMEQKFPSYPPNVQNAIRSNIVVEGMDKDAVVLSLGGTHCVYTANFQGKATEIWGYTWIVLSQKVGGVLGCNAATIRIHFENGRVIGWENFPNR